MKKSVILGLCGLLGFSALITADASVCSIEEQAEIKKVSSHISTTYEEKQEALDPSLYVSDGSYEPAYQYFFGVIFSNIDSKIYVKVTNDYNNEVKFIRYQDTDEGIYTFDWKNTDKITKFTYEVYSSAETSCPDEKYFTGYVILPKYNEFSRRVICNGISDFEACQKYIMVNMDPVEQERLITEYLDKKQQEEEQKGKKWYQKIGDLVNEHKVIIIAGSIIVIAGVATVVVKNKRKRVK